MGEPSRLSLKGTKFIAAFEGFSSRPYQDAVGVWTIGYGHTEGVGPESRRISKLRALYLLRKDAAAVVPYVKAAAKFRTPKLRQRELDALVSFGFNLGPGYFEKGHSIGNAMRDGRRRATANAMLLYDKAGGRPLAGLTRRRKAERRLFLSGNYSTE